MRTAVPLLLIAAASITSCSLASPELDLVFDKQGRLTIQTERIWRWFIIPDREDACLNALRVYDERRFVWEIRSRTCNERAFPITYGVSPAGFEVVTAPQSLVRGKRYGIAACGGYPLDTNMDFVLGAEKAKQIATDRTWENLIRSPYDRENSVRVAAMERGEKIPDIDGCTRLPTRTD